jgi:1,2-diacylglycerol 3-alpha-glucosyltransferase
MVTNTFTPHVGGVARSVEGFRAGLHALGHRVLVVAPQFAGVAPPDPGVVRLPALRHFNGGDYSVPLPVPGKLLSALDRFRPDVVHAHHPFLLGDTALRIAARRGLPVVFTQHTLYESVTHYVPGDSPGMRRGVAELAVGFCNLCDAVVAPSATIAELLRRRGVTARVAVIPSGVDLAGFAAGSRRAGRRAHGMPEGAFVVGHVGRLAPEKNLGFLAQAVGRFLAGRADARFLVVGEGPGRETMLRALAAAGVAGRVCFAGVLRGRALADAYHAMDVFAFASRNETQGMVLTEAMASGVPVVALDGPGVREVVCEGGNGRLLAAEGAEAFAASLAWVAALSGEERRRLGRAALATAEAFALPRVVSRMAALYESVATVHPAPGRRAAGHWTAARRRLAEEWKIWKNIAHAASALVRPRP